MRRRIDADFLASGDAAQIRAAADVLQGLIHPGAVVKRGEKQQAVKSFKEALDWLLAEARGSVAIQRYKGLGEMNPEQLWETTMDPPVRRLLKVQIEDAITSDDIFADADGRAGRAAPRLHRDRTRWACATSTSSGAQRSAGGPHVRRCQGRNRRVSQRVSASKATPAATSTSTPTKASLCLNVREL